MSLLDATAISRPLVDIDLDTGLVCVPRYLVVEDCGTMINPRQVEGQLHGGVVGGLGNRVGVAIGGIFFALLDYLLGGGG